MFNNLVFFSSAILVVCFSLICCRRSKESVIAWIALQSVLANLFVLKQITLFGLNATASDIFAIGSLLGLNLLREKYGFEEAKKAIGASFICMVFFAIMSQMHLIYQPSIVDTTQAAYELILVPNPRILLASIFVFFSVQLFDVYFYSFLKRKINSSNLILLNGTSLLVSQFLDTVFFSYLGLYGLVSAISQVILVAYSIKIIAILCMVPFSQFAKNWIIVKNN